MRTIYRNSLALLTDLYELTMAYGYWKQGLAEKEAVFHLTFRKRPFNGAFAIAAGLEDALDYISNFRFEADDLAYLGSLKKSEGSPLFEAGFLDYLSSFSFDCDIDAMIEGTPAFPNEPLIRVKGPIIPAQLLETPLLNIINFQTLIATKAARICFAARPDQVIEFGARRAQGVDGALSASRAAYIGGCEGTSHVLAGKIFGIPVRGTHAHSWVMLFDDEEASFRSFSEAMPTNCMFLIDTYDTLDGVKKAVRVAKEMRQKGSEMLGVRLDSGDLAHLSIEVRKILDESGFPDALIMASNELDEFIISDLKHQGAQINVWGVGTNLVTAKDQPALDGVYKLSAVRDPKGAWKYKVKLSEQVAKVTTPGILQVRRFFDGRYYIADMIFDTELGCTEPFTFVDPFDASRFKVLQGDLAHEDLLIPVMRRGKRVYRSPSIKEMQDRTNQQLSKFHPGIRRFLYPQAYFVGLEKKLYQTKLDLIQKIQS